MWLLGVSAALAQGPAIEVGQKLSEALQALRASGLDLFFSSQVVSEDLTVRAAPRGGGLRAVLDDLLAPHGLEAKEGPGGRLVVSPAPKGWAGRVSNRDGRPLEGVRVRAPELGIEAVTDASGHFRLPGPAGRRLRLEAHIPGYVIGVLDEVEARSSPILFQLDAVPGARDEILILPRARPGEGAAQLSELSRERLLTLPHFANDPLRAVAALPEAVARDGSSAIDLRGAGSAQTLILLDGFELLAPYHLQDFDSGISLLAPGTIGTVEVLAGGFPARYGDRLGGVVDLKTFDPGDASWYQLGVSNLQAQAGLSRRWGKGRGRWLLTGRAGTHQTVLEAAGREGNPSYWDVLGKVDSSPADRHALRLNLLAAGDRLLLGQSGDGSSTESYHTRWENNYAWLSHNFVPRSDLVLESIVSAGRLARRRRGGGEGEVGSFEIRDFRNLELAGFQHRALWQVSSRHAFEAGFELRRLRSAYDYSNDRELTGALAAIRDQPEDGTTAFLDRFPGEQTAAFLSDRRQWSRGELELGLRFDENTLTEDHQVSPRFSFAAQAGSRTVLRGSWGLFHQNQRAYELQVEDGETSFGRSERSDQKGLGVDSRLGKALSLSIDLYERRLLRPRARYENLFGSVAIFPELGVDRIRIAPDRGLARGIDVLLRFAASGPFSWSLGYGWGSIEDRVGGLWVANRNDRSHQVRAALEARLPARWVLSSRWVYHGGWPTTRLSGRTVVGDSGELEVVPVLGPLYGERFPEYHRLDLRFSRGFELRRGRLSVFLDVQNAYDRKNVRGLEGFELEPRPDGGPEVRFEPVYWNGILPTLGFTWER